MKITMYTVKTCEFSKQEKDYLTAKNLQFEEKDLESNREYLTEMLAVSNNFSGTPVTKIEKDDGQISVLKGYTKAEFDKIFDPQAVVAEAKPDEVKPTVDTAAATVPPDSTPPSPTPSPVPTPSDPAPIEEPLPPIPEPSTPALGAAPTSAPAITATPDPLHSILSDLQAKSQETPAAPTVVTPVNAIPQPATPATTPTVPEFPQN